jgi:hypothetical protein
LGIWSPLRSHQNTKVKDNSKEVNGKDKKDKDKIKDKSNAKSTTIAPDKDKSFATVKRGLSLSRTNTFAMSLINIRPIDHDNIKTSPVLHTLRHHQLGQRRNSLRTSSLPHVASLSDDDDDLTSNSSNDRFHHNNEKSARRLTFSPNATIFPVITPPSPSIGRRKSRFPPNWESFKKRSSSTLNFGSNFSLSKYFQNYSSSTQLSSSEKNARKAFTLGRKSGVETKSKKCTCDSNSSSGFCDDDDDDPNFIAQKRSSPSWASSLFKSFRLKNLKKNKIASTEDSSKSNELHKKHHHHRNQFFASFSGTLPTRNRRKRTNKVKQDFKEVTLDLSSGQLKGTQDGKLICLLEVPKNVTPNLIPSELRQRKQKAVIQNTTNESGVGGLIKYKNSNCNSNKDKSSDDASDQQVITTSDNGDVEDDCMTDKSRNCKRFINSAICNKTEDQHAGDKVIFILKSIVGYNDKLLHLFCVKTVFLQFHIFYYYS